MANVVTHKPNKISHDNCDQDTSCFSKIREKEYAVTKKQVCESLNGWDRQEGLYVTNVLKKDLTRFRNSPDIWGLDRYLSIYLNIYIYQANQVGFFHAETASLHALIGVNIRHNSNYCLTPKAAHLSLGLETLHMLFGRKYFFVGK